MIKYDYSIERDEDDERKVYVPSLDKELEDLVYIQGPNSSGKSTLLNIMALAFYGSKLSDDELNSSLREKLKNLAEADHQKLEFTVEINNTQSNIHLRAQKKPGKQVEVVKVGSGGKAVPFSYDQFKREFRLIYDIPHDPISRLPQLLNEIKYAQHHWGKQIVSLRTRLKDIIAEVREGKDPEKLAGLYDDLKTVDEELKKSLMTRDKKEFALRNFEKFFALQKYIHTDEELRDLRAKITRLETVVNKEEKRDTKQSKDLVDSKKKLSEKLTSAKESHKKVLNSLKNLLPKSESHHVAIWKEVNCEKEIEDSSNYTEVRTESKHLEVLLNKILKSESKEKGEAEFLHLLLQVAEKFSAENFQVPGTGLSVKAFIETVKQRNKEFRKVLNDIDNINSCLKDIKNLQDDIDGGMYWADNIKEVLKKRGEAFHLKDDLIDEELEAAKSKAETLVKQFADCKVSLIKLDIFLESVNTEYPRLKAEEGFEAYAGYSNKQLDELLIEFRSEAYAGDKAYTQNEKHKQLIQLDITRLEKKGPHKYQNYLPQLEAVLTKVLNLEKAVTVKFDENINRLIKADNNEKNLSDEEKQYAEEIQKFLAAKIGRIRHIDTEHTIARVDVIKKEIITTGKKRIKFADLGTGQSQGAYIEGLLSANDNKKIIALFDEVAMMDGKTLKPIFDKLKTLYNANKLLAGIIVQKNDEKILIKSLLKSK